MHTKLHISYVKIIPFYHQGGYLWSDPTSGSKVPHRTLSKCHKSIKALEFGFGNAIFEIFKKKTYGKEVLFDGVKRLIRLAQARRWAKAAPPLCLC